MLLSAVPIVLAALVSNDGCGPSWPVPVVRELQDEFRQMPNLYTETVRERHGYYLGTLSPTLFPSGKWIVVDLKELRARWPAGGSIIPGPDTDPTKIPRAESTLIAVLAIDPRSGKTHQLTLPAGRKSPGYSFGIEGFFPLGSDRCGVVAWRERDPPSKEYSVWNRERYLWEWHLDTNTVTRVGNWVPLHRLFSVVDLSSITVCWRRPRVNNSNLEVTVQDNRTRKLAHISLDTSNLFADPRMPAIEYAQWFAPANDGGAFVICDSLDPKHSKLQVSCVDPRVRSGRRWVLSQDDLQRLIGVKPELLAPFPNSARQSTRLPVLVHGYLPDTDESVYRLLLIDTATGNVLRSINLDFGYWPTTPVVSPDGRVFVYVDGVGAQHIFKLMSLEDGSSLGEFDALPNHGYVYPFAFADDSTLLASDENAIWAFDISEGWSAKRIFQLAGLTAGD